MDVRDEFFRKLHGAAGNSEAADEQRHLVFEDFCVRFLCRRVGIPLNVKQARLEAASSLRTNMLSFTWFHHLQPAFPVRLSGSKLRHTSGERIGWTQLFGSGFGKLPWVKELTTLADKLGKDLKEDPLCLVFNAPHANKASLMVIHNHLAHNAEVVDPELRNSPETRIIRPHGNHGIVFVIESFAGFLAHVGKEWITIPDGWESMT